MVLKNIAFQFQCMFFLIFHNMSESGDGLNITQYISKPKNNGVNVWFQLVDLAVKSLRLDGYLQLHLRPEIPVVSTYNIL